MIVLWMITSTAAAAKDVVFYVTPDTAEHRGQNAQNTRAFRNYASFRNLASDILGDRSDIESSTS